MIVPNLRPLLLLLAGATVGSLVTFGLLSRQTSPQGNLVQSGHPSETLRAPVANAERQENSDNPPGLSPETKDSPDSEGTANFLVQAAKQHVPIRPLPKPTMAFQANGLPVGVTTDAGNSEVYKRLPGVQPPLINRDGRDMGPEAIQMVETPREPIPFPGGIPSASASPMPFPQTVEEINRQAEAYASPSATP